MKVSSVKEAWELAHRLFPADYKKDEEMSSRAGYPIYHSTAEGVNVWISDLGNRLEKECVLISHGIISGSTFGEMIPDIYKERGKFYAALVYGPENGKPEYELTLC